MTIVELRNELKAILALEEQVPPDWQEVEKRSLRLIAELSNMGQATYPHDVVYQFLDDPDVRQKSTAYAERQRHRLREWLNKS